MSVFLVKGRKKTNSDPHKGSLKGTHQPCLALLPSFLYLQCAPLSFLVKLYRPHPQGFVWPWFPSPSSRRVIQRMKSSAIIYSQWHIWSGTVSRGLRQNVLAELTGKAEMSAEASQGRVKKAGFGIETPRPNHCTVIKLEKGVICNPKM